MPDGTMIIAFLAVVAVGGGVLARLKNDYFIRGVCIALITNVFGLAVLALSPRSSARSGSKWDEHHWPENSLYAVAAAAASGFTLSFGGAKGETLATLGVIMLVVLFATKLTTPSTTTPTSEIGLSTDPTVGRPPTLETAFEAEGDRAMEFPKTGQDGVKGRPLIDMDGVFQVVVFVDRSCPLGDEELTQLPRKCLESLGFDYDKIERSDCNITLMRASNLPETLSEDFIQQISQRHVAAQGTFSVEQVPVGSQDSQYGTMIVTFWRADADLTVLPELVTFCYGPGLDRLRSALADQLSEEEFLNTVGGTEGPRIVLESVAELAAERGLPAKGNYKLRFVAQSPPGLSQEKLNRTLDQVRTDVARGDFFFAIDGGVGIQPEGVGLFVVWMASCRAVSPAQLKEAGDALAAALQNRGAIGRP